MPIVLMLFLNLNFFWQWPLIYYVGPTNCLVINMTFFLFLD